MSHKVNNTFRLKQSVDTLDPFHLKPEITVMKRSNGEAYMVRAAVNTTQYGKPESLAVEHWDFTKAMRKDPKSDIATRDYKLIMEEARVWLQKQMNIYKYPSH